MEFSNCSVKLNRIADEEVRRLCAPVNDNESVIFAGCGMELPNCAIVLNRITDEEIYSLCAPGSSTETASDFKDNEGLKRRKRTRCGEGRRKIRHRKRGAANTDNTNKLEFYTLKKRRFINRKIPASLSDFCLSWSSDETEFEREKRKKKVKRQRTLKKIRQLTDSSGNNSLKAVVNVHSSNLNSDANSNLQSPNPSSNCDLHHQVETSTLDISANHLSDEQIDNTGQRCSFISDSELFYEYSSFEDIPLSTLKNMNDLEYKNTRSFFYREIQSNDNKIAKPKRRKRKKRLKMSSQNENPCSDGDTENFAQLKKSTSETQQLDGIAEKNEVDIICSPLLTTFKESEAYFPFDHEPGGLHKSPNYDWNNEMSLKSSREKICASRGYLGRDNLPSTDGNSEKGLESNGLVQIKREKETESQVPKIFKKSKLQEYFVEKERKTFEVNELDVKSDQLTRVGREEENSNNKVITNELVKTNEPNEKSNNRKSQNNEVETIIACSKQTQSGNSLEHLILNKMAEYYQTVQPLDKTISHDTREGIKINHVNITDMQKEPYICKYSISKDVKTDSISVTKSNLNNTLPPIKISIDLNILKLELKTTADNRLDLLNVSDSEEKCHLQYKYQKLHVLEKFKSDKICKLYDIKKTPESDNIKDAYLCHYDSPTVLSNVQANHLYCQENFQNKITPLKTVTSPPQCDEKTDFNKTMPYVKNVIKVSTTNPSEIPLLMTSNGLPHNTFFATCIPINENANTLLPCENISSPVCSLINPSIPGISSERHFSTEIPSYSKKARMSYFSSFDSANIQNCEIKVSNVYGIKCFEGMNSHLPEFNKVAPVRLHTNISDLNSKANETNIRIEENSCLSLNIERKPTSEMHPKNVAELFTNDSLKQAFKASVNVLSATDILEVVTRLAIADLEENPRSHLKTKITIGKDLVKKLLSKKRITLQLNDLISSIQYDLYVLNIAEQYLHFYGSFSKVSDYFLKKL